MDDPKTPAGKRPALKRELQELDSRWVLTELEVQHLLVSVAELRFVRVESEIPPLARERLFDLIGSLLARDQPALAQGLIENVLQRREEGRSAVALSEADVARLKQFAAEAERRFLMIRP
jgi:hypothetical protein